MTTCLSARVSSISTSRPCLHWGHFCTESIVIRPSADYVPPRGLGETPGRGAPQASMHIDIWVTNLEGPRRSANYDERDHSDSVERGVRHGRGAQPAGRMSECAEDETERDQAEQLQGLGVHEPEDHS